MASIFVKFGGYSQQFLRIHKFISAVILVLSFGTSHAQVNSPEVKCLFVQTNGDVLLTWLVPPDPNNQFISYEVFSNSTLGPGFTPIASVAPYLTTTYTHNGAGANTQAIYYYVLTKYNNSGITLSTPLDTFSTIYLTVTNPGSPYGTLTYNPIHNPLPITNSGSYDIYSDSPGPNTFSQSTTLLTIADTQHICLDSIRYYVENSDNTGCVSRSNTDNALFKDNIIPVTPTLDSVSVDPLTSKATMGWEVSTSGDVVAYFIYQYISGFWVQIATVNGIGSTFYTYPASNAGNISEMYCMAAVDSCGNVSPLGNNQNTIHATGTLDQCLHTVSLSWNAYVNWPSAPTGYTIFQSFNAGPFAAVGTVGPGVTSFIDNVAINGNYCYIIRAYGPTGKTSSSQQLCFNANLSVQPVFTYVTTATVLNAAQIQINTYVDLAASVMAYRLERASSFGDPFAVVSSQPYTGSPIITFIDNTAAPQTQSYFYQVISIDSCGNDAQVSAFSQTIHLTATPNPDRTNTLNWNHYQGWLGAVGSYDIYRSLDGGPFMMIANVAFPTNTYIDDVDPFYPLNGKFTYYVEAHEAAMNIFNFQEASKSNPADCYQFSKFFIPNAFAPHGVNVTFLPLGAYYDKTEYEMYIFDRWGEKLFENKDPLVGWDGTYNGSPCYQGVYIYLIRYKSSVGEIIEHRGTVTLLGK